MGIEVIAAQMKSNRNIERLLKVLVMVELEKTMDHKTAEKALEMRLVNRVYEDKEFLSETMELAQELANGPTVALGITRRLLWDSWDRDFEQQLDQEELIQRDAFDTADAIEGPSALLEKREAKFQGK